MRILVADALEPFAVAALESAGHTCTVDPDLTGDSLPSAIGDAEALIIYQGADAYIRPGWYPSKTEHGKVVPTWNYVAVHAYGVLRFVREPDALRRHLARLTATHEGARAQPWSITDAPADYIEKQLGAIVGVEIAITRLEGKWKMSQNRSAEDVQGVIEGLGASEDPREREVAEIVKGRAGGRVSG